jgi:hypothetical protein
MARQNADAARQREVDRAELLEIARRAVMTEVEAREADAARQREVDRAELAEIKDRLQKPKVRSRGGRPEDWDWRGLDQRIRREGLKFGASADLKKFCQLEVKRTPNCAVQTEYPDDRTTRDAIKRYRWKDIALKNHRGN